MGISKQVLWWLFTSCFLLSWYSWFSPSSSSSSSSSSCFFWKFVVNILQNTARTRPLDPWRAFWRLIPVISIFVYQQSAGVENGSWLSCWKFGVKNIVFSWDLKIRDVWCSSKITSVLEDIFTKSPRSHSKIASTKTHKNTVEAWYCLS